MTGERDLLVVRNLKKYYPIRSGLLQRPSRWIKAVDDVSFTIRAGASPLR